MMREDACACAREGDVLDCVAAQRWPEGADDSLRAHVAGCPVCADLALAAGALAEIDPADADARLPDATVIWYGARLLARTENARRAARPLLVAQGAGLLLLAAALGAGWMAVSPAIAGWWAAVRPVSWPAGWWSWASGSWPWPPMPAWSALTDWLARTTSGERWMLAVLALWPLLVPAALSLVRIADRGEPPARPTLRP